LAKENNKKKKPDEPEQPEKKKETWPEFIASMASVLVIGLFIITFNLQAFEIPSSSMENTLLIGDHVFVDRITLAPKTKWAAPVVHYRDVKRGDIIVFRYPEDIRMTFVKRAIGIPGDRIRLVNKDVYRNGVKLDEPYKIHKSDYIDPYRDNFPSQPDHISYAGQEEMLRNHVVNGEVVVPPDSVFAMGDNRDNSSDSRYWGFVPRANIIGKPLIIYWSYSASTDQLQDPSISVTHIVDLVKNFVPKTRWTRTFRLIHGYAGQ
jgi:signal peptidase I